MLRIALDMAVQRAAYSWYRVCRDNVGVLIDATSHFGADAHTDKTAYSVMLANDLTPAVLEEARSARVCAVVVYHPTPFSPMKTFSLTAASHASTCVLACAKAGIGVYSPHTAWDALAGGVNDWLVHGVAWHVHASTRLEPCVADHTAVRECPHVRVRAVKPADEALLRGLPVGSGQVYGDGRIAELACDLSEGVTLQALADGVKAFLRLPSIRIALPSGAVSGLQDDSEAGSVAAAAMAQARRITVRSFAVCAGSGGSILAGVDADAYITGEMSHHDVLAANAAGRAVILTEHSNCERGFLAVARRRLLEGWADEQASTASSISLEVVISRADRDPLITV